MSKVFLFGIDGTPPDLLFEEWIDELPNIKGLMEKGVYSKLETVIPPTTIMAWTAIASGRDPGEIGVYSYTSRPSLDSDKVSLVDSNSKK